MVTVTFQVVDGVDKGRVFRQLATPLTIGREEGNSLRLTDERVSRFHAKVQQDNDDIILTDLESTNGTRVNGNVVQIRRLRLGDLISVGRSLLLFGSNEEIANRLAAMATSQRSPSEGKLEGSHPKDPSGTLHASYLGPHLEQNLEFDLNAKDDITIADGNLFVGNRSLPPLPKKLSPSQAARLAEILDFLHGGLTRATINLNCSEEGTEIHLPFADWQKVLAVQMLLARYLRAVGEPESMSEEEEGTPSS